MKIKCLIVDDEPLAVKLIENHIAKIEALEVVATANNALKAFEILTNKQVDLMFLDIKMPNITGIDFLKSLKNPPKTILTTAYRDFAIEGFELEVIDYLLKPITFERFFKSVERVIRTPILLPVIEQKQEFLLLKASGKNYRIVLDEILFIESIKDYVKVHKTDGAEITAKYKIGDLENELLEKSFTRVHRSFIVNNRRITAFSLTDFELGSVQIPIGSSYKEQSQKLIDYLKII